MDDPPPPPPSPLQLSRMPRASGARGSGAASTTTARSTAARAEFSGCGRKVESVLYQSGVCVPSCARSSCLALRCRVSSLLSLSSPPPSPPSRRLHCVCACVPVTRCLSSIMEVANVTKNRGRQIPRAGSSKLTPNMHTDDRPIQQARHKTEETDRLVSESLSSQLRSGL